MNLECVTAIRREFEMRHFKTIIIGYEISSNGICQKGGPVITDVIDQDITGEMIRPHCLIVTENLVSLAPNSENS